MHIFITGGTRGIGNGLVKEFIQKGCKVSFTGTRQKSIDEAKKNLEGDFLALVCDVRNKVEIEKAMKQALQKFGDIDIWINNAGVDQERLDLSDLSEEEIRRVVDINVIGTMIGSSTILKQMKLQNHGTVYNLEGLGSNNMVIPQTIIYGSTKRLITYFTKGCNKELKDFPNIQVGTIQPGMVFTDLLLNNMSEEGMKIANILGNDVDHVAKKVVKNVLRGNHKIKIMNNFQVFGRFITYPFKKKK